MNVGTYLAHPTLDGLPVLVRKQRTLEATIAAIAEDVDEEKRLRQAIDLLLIGAGIAPGEGVTCNGYDVTHHSRVGSSRLDQDQLVRLLVADGVDPDWLSETLVDCTIVGEPPLWATVKPMKGSQVRKRDTAIMAKAGLKARKQSA